MAIYRRLLADIDGSGPDVGSRLGNLISKEGDFQGTTQGIRDSEPSISRSQLLKVDLSPLSGWFVIAEIR